MFNFQQSTERLLILIPLCVEYHMLHGTFLDICSPCFGSLSSNSLLSQTLVLGRERYAARTHICLKVRYKKKYFWMQEDQHTMPSPATSTSASNTASFFLFFRICSAVTAKLIIDLQEKPSLCGATLLVVADGVGVFVCFFTMLCVEPDIMTQTVLNTRSVLARSTCAIT